MRKQLWLFLVFGLLFVSSVAAYQFYDPYGYGGGLGGFGDLSGFFSSFLDFLEDNQYVVDAVVFLVIFLIISKKVFYKNFSDDKALYIVIGIALTIGIMVYERRLGFSLIFNSAWLSLVALLAFAAYMASTTEITGIRLTVISLLLLVAFAIIIPDEAPSVFFAIRGFLGKAYDLLVALLFIAFCWGIVRILFPKKTQRVANAIPPGLGFMRGGGHP